MFSWGMVPRSLDVHRLSDYDGCKSPRLGLSRRNSRFIEDDETQASTGNSVTSPGGIRPQREQGERMRINISGKIFETYKTTLTSKAGSIFRLDGISRMFDANRNEYYFERDPKAFENILVYMQCGLCVKPDNVPYKVFIEDLQFFGFAEIAIKIYEDNCAAYQRKLYVATDTNNTSNYFWHVLEFPRMDVTSKCLTLFSSAVTILSTISIVAQSLPIVKESPVAGEVIHNIQLVCLSWFIIETCARFLTFQNKKYFFKNPINVLDVLTILPDVIYAFLTYVIKMSLNKRHMFYGSVLRVLRMTRLIPASGSDDLNRTFTAIMITIGSSGRELGFVLSVLVFVVILFACVLYIVENAVSPLNEDFSSVPKNVWFCFVTITSVGYGDKTPKSIGVKLVTFVMFGATIIILTIPIPIIIGNFARAHDVSKDCSLENFYIDHDISTEVKRTLDELSNKENKRGDRIRITVSDEQKIKEMFKAAQL